MTLLEVMISIMIVSMVLVGVFAGLTSTVQMSRTNGERAALDDALAGVSTSVSAMPYTRCRTASEMTNDYRTWANAYRPSGYTITVTDVAYATPGATAFVAACPAGNAPKRLTIRVVADAEAGSMVTGQVVVRDPVAAP